MGITSRRKRPLERKIPYLRDTRLIIIATEGSRTEKQYFESNLIGSLRVQVKVLETVAGFSAPNYFLKRIQDFAKETDLQPDDQLWLMVDKDRWPDALLDQVCAPMPSIDAKKRSIWPSAILASSSGFIYITMIGPVGQSPASKCFMNYAIVWDAITKVIWMSTVTGWELMTQSVEPGDWTSSPVSVDLKIPAPMCIALF